MDAKQLRRLLKLAEDRRNPQIYRDAHELWEFLEPEPYFGTLEDLAYELDMSYARVSRVVGLSRKTDWKEKFGWTVPYVEKGPGPKEWRVAIKGEDADFLRQGNRTRKRYLAQDVERLKSSFELQYKLASTSQQKALAQYAMVSMRHVLELMEMDSVS